MTGIFGQYGACIELPGTMSGGYSFGLRRRDRLGQVPEIPTVVFDVISVFVRGVERPPQ